jgi:hypothetical protein
MAGDKSLHEAVERIEAATTEIKAAIATQTALIRADQDVLKNILATITPEDGAGGGGVPLDELLAELIVLMRDHGKKLSLILQILQPGSTAGSSGSSSGPPAAAPSGTPGGRRS